MVDVASQIWIHDYLQLLGISLMYWDWLVTLDNEVGFMWKRARSASACWFFAVRYSGILGNIPVTVFTFYNIPVQVPAAHSNSTANTDSLFCSGAIYITRAIKSCSLGRSSLFPVIVMLVRIHALYERNLRVLAALLVIGFPLLAVIFWSVKGPQSTLEVSFPGCHTSVPKSSNYRLAGAWLALFVFDSLCFGLTLYKTFSTWRRTGSEANHLPIHTLVLRDGAVYYAAMTLANLSNIISFYIGGPILSGSLSTFASCVSVTLMARLMLNLHITSNLGRDPSISHVDLELEEHVPSPVVFRRAGPFTGVYSAPERDVDVVERDSHSQDLLHGPDVERQGLREGAW
ncbi:hypothetical protein MSAN_01731200 [Mycena sanguinolenta]|uniref:DUF6533 domain-containing protein n=1 Tax=Mycena sanguinolenta TaxID=230812 RepID=A0A8H6XWB6_9AGAR|nr:hypothetical protein MSAN_01731200 [Mycena sanguinolenta]